MPRGGSRGVSHVSGNRTMIIGLDKEGKKYAALKKKYSGVSRNPAGNIAFINSREDIDEVVRILSGKMVGKGPIRTETITIKELVDHTKSKYRQIRLNTEAARYIKSISSSVSDAKSNISKCVNLLKKKKAFSNLKRTPDKYMFITKNIALEALRDRQGNIKRANKAKKGVKRTRKRTSVREDSSSESEGYSII